MIIEAIVSTMNRDGQINFAPMGVLWETQPRIRPYRDTVTYRNLAVTGEGVINITDDVLIFAQSALSAVSFDYFPAKVVRGAVLRESCYYYEFVVRRVSEEGERAEFWVEVVSQGRLRDFLGFNRGKNAVIEATILATRVGLHDPHRIREELERLSIIAQKTGGSEEKEAMELLMEYVRTHTGGMSRKRPGSSKEVISP
jgi:hypothetical protein